MVKINKKITEDEKLAMEKYLQEIVDAYHSGAENNEEISLRRLADEFDITLMKARKLLITAGAYHSDLSDYINQLKEEGKSVEEIMQLTRLSRSSVHSYLPYTRAIYNANEASAYAERCRLYRQRKNTVIELKQCISKKNQALEEVVWQTIQLFSRYTFTTKKGVKFRYIINKGAVCVLGKDVDITRNTVNVAVNMVMEKGNLSEMEWLRLYGGAYLEVIFERIGMI